MKCVLNFLISYWRDSEPIKIKFLEQKFPFLLYGMLYKVVPIVQFVDDS